MTPSYLKISAACMLTAMTFGSALADETVMIQDFSKIINEQRAQYEAGDTEIRRTYARMMRAQRLCQLHTIEVKNWLGRVVEVVSDNDGNAGLVLIVAPGVYVRSMEGLITKGTMKSPHDPLYQVLLSLQRGDVVAFSGEFQSDSQDCFEELSFTEEGSMEEPEYEFDFMAIRKH